VEVVGGGVEKTRLVWEKRTPRPYAKREASINSYQFERRFSNNFREWFKKNVVGPFLFPLCHNKIKITLKKLL
jgi:hypothetical protein